jgi:hypothetical protein
MQQVYFVDYCWYVILVPAMYVETLPQQRLLIKMGFKVSGGTKNDLHLNE